MKTHQNTFGQPIGSPLPDWQPPLPPHRRVISGKSCDLVPLSPNEHGAGLFEAFTSHPNDALWTYMAYGPFPTRPEYEAWLDANCRSSDPLFFTLIEAKVHRPVGVASYLRITPSAASIEVGHIVFSAQCQRSRVATEAMYLMMRNAFELGYRRYEWKCDALNGPSRAAATRLGFQYEGTFLQAAVYKNRNRDTAWFSITDKEWPALKRVIELWLDDTNFDAQGQQRVRLSELTRPLMRTERSAD